MDFRWLYLLRPDLVLICHSEDAELRSLQEVVTVCCEQWPKKVAVCSQIHWHSRET